MNDSGQPTSEDAERWDRLTDKQHACLALLLEHLTSKQIARRLHISKYTVDQRLTSARDILGTATRGETAVAYARLQSLCDRVAYHPVDIHASPTAMPSDLADGGQNSVLMLSDSAARAPRAPGDRPPFGTIWRHDHLPSSRTVIMVAVLLALAIIPLAGLGIAQALNELLSR